MKKLIVTMLTAVTFATPAMAFDVGSIDGIPSEMKEMIAGQSGGRVTNKQGQQGGQQGQQQVGQDGRRQQQGRRQARKKPSSQEKAMQQADQFMKGEGGLGQGVGSFR